MMNVKNRLLVLTLCVMNLSNWIAATVYTRTPMMSRVYGDRYTPEIVQNPQEGLLGTVNLGFGSAGSLNMFDQLADSTTPAVRILSNGSIFVLLSSETATALAMYSGAGVYQESFTFSGVLQPYFMQLDSQANLLLGGDGGWLQRFNTTAQFFDGDFVARFSSTAGTWDFIGNIAEQSNGNLIITGLKDSYTQVARLLPSGALDTTFGVDGFIIFDGHAGSGDSVFPTSITGAYNVVVTQDDSIVVAYYDNETSHAFAVKFVMNGQLATGFGDEGIRTNVVGASVVVPNQIYTALNDSNGIIIGATIVDTFNSIGLLAFNLDSGNYAGDIAPMNIPSSGDNSVQISSVMTLSNGAIVVTSSDFSTLAMRVDQFLADGTIDTDFNADDTPGFLEFSITPSAGDLSGSFLQGAAIAPNGQLFVAGYQTTLDPISTIPYLSQVYEYSYSSEISQYPTPILQGVIDENFGVPFGLSKNKQTYPGIVSPYVGDYRGNLQQHPTAIMPINYGTVPAVGDLLVGMYGSTNNSSAVTMMLNWLTPYGVLDDNLGDNFSGQLILPNLTTTQEFPSNEFLYGLAQDVQGALYVAGGVAGENYRGATLRKYTPDVTAGWTNGTDTWNVIDSNEDIQKVGIAMQGQDRILLFEACGSYGTIAAFDAATGHLADGTEGASSFGQDGTGYINYVDQEESFINLGPVYAGVINTQGQIFVAYTNDTTGKVDLAAFLADGSGLLTSFGTAGIISILFELTGTWGDDFGINQSSVRIAFDSLGNLIICAFEESYSNILVAKTNQLTGAVDTYFGDNGIATINFNNGMLTQLQVISDGSIVMTGFLNYNQIAVIRLTSQGELDTTFDAQGAQPGVSIISAEVNPYQASANAVAVQSSVPYTGDLIVIGEQYLYSSDSTPMVMRLFGQPDTTAVRTYPEYLEELGTLDQSFNGTGGFNLSNLIANYGTAKIVYAYPADSQYAGLLLIAVNTGDSTNIARFNPVTLALDTTFNADGETPGLYIANVFFGLSALIVDANDRIVFAGYDSGVAWAQRLTADGAFDVSFEIPTTAPYLTLITTIAQQKSGRYIFAGNFDDEMGGIVAYQDELVGTNTTLQIDTTFNPMGANPGYFDVINFPVYSMVINQDDTIVAAWAFGTLFITKITANGSGLVEAFGVDGLADTGIEPSYASSVRIALDASENIIAVGATSTEAMQVVRYTSAGIIDTNWNSGQITTVTGMGHSVFLTSILESTTGQTLLLGFNTIRRVNGIHGPLFAVSLNTTGALDTTWNPNANPGDVPGILTYQVDSSGYMGIGAFAVDGNLYTVGATLDNEPLIMKILANGVMATQQPLATNPGIIDTTINTQGTGYDSLNLNDHLSFAPGVPQRLNILSNENGAMIMGSLLDTTAYITKLNADLTLDTNFNASGTSGYVEVTDVTSMTDLFVNDGNGNDGNIYATGSIDGSSIWAQLIGSDGNFQIPLTAANLLTASYAIREGNNNILIAGQSSVGGTHGTIAAFNSDLTQLDVSFGNGTPGYYVTESSSPIAAMTVDNQYRIYTAYKSGHSLVVQRILANGSGVDPDFNVTVTVRACHLEQISMCLDQVHNQLVVVDYYLSDLNVSRFSTIDGSLTGSERIAVGFRLTLSDLIVDTDQNIYVVAYVDDYVEESPYTTIVARFNSTSTTTIDFDSSYAADGGTPGIAQVAISPLDSFGYSIGAAILHPDRRVYLVGAAADGTPYMARFFGDNYATQIDQALPALNPGDFDPTYGNGLGYAVTFADGGSYDTGRNQQVKSIKHLQSTNLMTVIDDGVNSWTLRVLQDGSNDPSYGPTPGGQGALIAKLSGNESVSNMIVSGNQEYFVIGNNSGSGKGYLKKITATGAMDSTFGGYTGISTTRNYPAGTVYRLMSNPASLVELSDGNIVVVGNNAGIGTMQLVGSTGLVSTTFGGAGTIINGNNIAAISADASDNLYVAVGYLNGDMNAVRVMKLNSEGQLDTTFGENGIVDVIGGIADYANIQLALDAQDNIMIAVTAQVTAGVFTVIRLLPDGTFDPNFNNDDILNIELPNSATAVANLANIVPLQDGRILIAGYQQDDDTSENNIDFVVCLTYSGALDTTFNQSEAQGSIPGIAMFLAGGGPEQSCPLYNIDVQANGQIVAATSQAAFAAQSAPFTIRLIGYENVQAIAQYPGDVPVVPSVLNPVFNGTGVSGTPRDLEISLISGGPVVLDSYGNTIIAGVTSDLEFVVARFAPDGTYDTDFGTDGIGTSSLINNLIASSCSITIDQDDNVFIGGITITNEFVVVKFDASGNVVNDYGTDGISSTVADSGIILLSGGYLATYTGDTIIIAGYSSTGQFAFNQLDIDGDVMERYASQAIPMLTSGGHVAFDSQNSLFISGATSVGNLVAVKFSQVDTIFTQDTVTFGTSGVASVEIVDGVNGGAITIDSYDNIIIAGYTSDETVAVARFTPNGIIDPLFNVAGTVPGVAYSNPIVSLQSTNSISVGTLDDIIIGGYARDYSGLNSMIVAVFTKDGEINTQFSATGIGSTGSLELRTVPYYLSSGGFVAITPAGQINLGGVQFPSIMTPASSRLVVAQMYSGYEIFITDPSTLSPVNLKTYYYGNNLNYFNSALDIDFFAEVIADTTTRQIVVDAVKANIAEFIVIYENVPGFNLTWHVYLNIASLQGLAVNLIETYESSSESIGVFFDAFINRINGLKI